MEFDVSKILSDVKFSQIRNVPKKTTSNTRIRIFCQLYYHRITESENGFGLEGTL